MDITRIETSMDAHGAAIDTAARSLQGRLPRRRVAGLLAAALATGLFGISAHSESAEARRKRRKQGRRTAQQAQPAPTDPELIEPNQSQFIAARGTAGTSIPPNCIYVCCDGTCDSWKMCLKCVKWPKGTTTAAMAS
jgi:hypothetical protein